MKLLDDIYVGALMITNSMGNIRNPDTGETLAGATDESGRFIEFDSFLEQYVRRPKSKENTTIGIVATNADLSHEELIKMVQMAHDGLAMSIRPTHTTSDGDTIFAVSTRKAKLEDSRPRALDAIGFLAAKCVATSIMRSVESSRFSRTSEDGRSF
jgi:L-aminopeptidase/D-esterase-like protein